MANPGKNKTLNWLRVYVDEYELSCDARAVGTFHNEWDSVDMTGWCNLVRNSTFGNHTVGVDGFAAFLNDATTGAFDTLKSSASLGVSFLFGGGAEPTIGDPAYLMGGVQLGDLTGWDGQAAIVNAAFEPSYLYVDAKPWGVILSDDTSRTATVSLTAVDNGAATTAGWSANLHVIASSGGTWAAIIEQSATGAFAGEETTLVTFAADGSAIAFERQVGTDSVAQHLRAKLTRTSGTMTAIITFARN
jgi:hypothetical protein